VSPTGTWSPSSTSCTRQCCGTRTGTGRTITFLTSGTGTVTYWNFETGTRYKIMYLISFI
jgi:hypothetical protein